MAGVSGVTLAAGRHLGPAATDSNIHYILYTAGKCLAHRSPPAHESTLFALASRNTGATLFLAAPE